jgi:hypothetical protein
VGGEWVEQEVLQVEYVLAGVFMITSFGIAIPGAISCFRATRFLLAMTAATMLLISAIIVPADSWDAGLTFEFYSWDLLFFPLLGGLTAGLVILARPGFTDPKEGIMSAWMGRDGRDGYGWQAGDHR